MTPTNPHIEATDGLHRDGKPLTDAEFRAAATHVWINALTFIRPTEKQLADLGRQVLATLADSDLHTTPFGDWPTSPAVVMWFNKS